MYFFLAIAAHCIASAASLAVSEQGTILPSNALKPPPPAPDGSVDEWLTQLFGPLENSSSYAPNSTLSARTNPLDEYREYAGIHELAWTNDTTEVTYNISIDFSKSCTGLALNDTIGVYTFSNGTTTNDTKLQDMIADIWSLKPTKDDPRRRLANHTATLARLAIDEAEALAPELICQSNQTTSESLVKAAAGASDGDIIHNELRKLLETDPRKTKSYVAIFILSVLGGAGVGAGGAAGVQRAFTGEVQAENVVQTAVVIGLLGIVLGMLNRAYELGLMELWVGNAGTYVRQNVVELIAIAVDREVNRRVADYWDQRRRQSIAGLAGDGASQDFAGFSAVDGQTTPDSLAGGRSGPVTPNKGSPARGAPSCLPNQQALATLNQINEFESQRYRLQPFGRVLEWEQSRLSSLEAAEEGEAGPSGLNCPVWSDPSTGTDIATGEASAADLVQVQNMASASTTSAAAIVYGGGGNAGLDGVQGGGFDDKGKGKVPGGGRRT